MDRRRSARVPARFEALVSVDGHEGGGVLADISYSGARLDECSGQPPVGSRVRLYIYAEPTTPFEVVGRVVRHTETGFAISYEIHDVGIRRLVDAITACAAEPATG